MKRIGNLWPGVITFDNLYRAAYRVLRGKRGQVRAGHFFFDLEGELFRLQRELISQIYRPGGYRTFWISDPKPRLISAASFRDRIVHHALVQVIEPVFERRFIHHSYACRKGKGNHRALRQFVKWARSARYVLKLDVRKFFPSIDHEILKKTIRAAIKDVRVLELCDLIIDGSNRQERVVMHFPGDDLLSPILRRLGASHLGKPLFSVCCGTAGTFIGQDRSAGPNPGTEIRPLHGKRRVRSTLGLLRPPFSPLFPGSGDPGYLRRLHFQPGGNLTHIEPAF